MPNWYKYEDQRLKSNHLSNLGVSFKMSTQMVIKKSAYGGVALHVKSNLEYIIRDDFNTLEDESERIPVY